MKSMLYGIEGDGVMSTCVLRLFKQYVLARDTCALTVRSEDNDCVARRQLIDSFFVCRDD